MIRVLGWMPETGSVMKTSLKDFHSLFHDIKYIEKTPFMIPEAFMCLKKGGYY